MTPKTLRACGEALYGGEWISPLARAIPCDPSYIHRMLRTGPSARPVTARIEQRIRELLAERRIEIDRLLAA